MKFNYETRDSWAPLAWLAKIRAGIDEIQVVVGPRVETQTDWFCEAIWDGEYGEGSFDQTDVVFGSGGRLRHGRAVFVSAGTTQDRLHSLRQDGVIWISNSLPCLLAASGASVDPTYPRYHQDLHTIIGGLQAYKRVIETTAGPVRLTYYHNLLWDGQSLAESGKPEIRRDFSSFSGYRAFLDRSLGLLAGNLSSPARRHPYEMLGTISSGYDSAASVALARKYGLRRAVTFERCRGGVMDSGEDAAARLGVEVVVRDREAWRSLEFPSVPFIAVNVESNEVFLNGAADLIGGKVLVTGFHGDGVWKKPLAVIHEDIPRVDLGGMSISEFRLRIGFISLAVPYLGVRQLEDIHKISCSEAMADWDIPGSYSRPIPRRIIEEAGLPRSSFGMEKRAAAVLLFEKDSFLTAVEMKDYRQWLRDNLSEWTRRGEAPPTQFRLALVNFRKRLSLIIAPLCYLLAGIMPGRGFFGMKERLTDLGDDLRVYGKREYLFTYVFPWALARAKERYK